MANTKLINFDHLQSAVTTIKGYTDTELAKKSNNGHIHDDRYYTETEMNTKIDTINTSISTAQSTAISTAKSYTDTAISNLIDSAPEAMNTLKELATAISNHQDVFDGYVGSIAAQLANKSDKDHRHDNATVALDGFMSADDKKKLDTVEQGANKITIDSTLSSTSGNPLANKTIYEELAKKQDVHNHNAYINQNAFSYISIDGKSIAAENATDTLTINAGENITLTADTTNDSFTITAKDTIYTHPSYAITAASYGNAENQNPGYGDTFNVPYITVNALGHITGITNKTVKIPASDNTDYKVKTTQANTTKLYITGCTKSDTGELQYDNGVYLDTTAGHLTANTFNGALNGNANTATTATTANKTQQSIIVKLNGGSTEGTNLFTFDGSTKKTIDITPSKIGAPTNDTFNAAVAQATDSEVSTMLTTIFGE